VLAAAASLLELLRQLEQGLGDLLRLRVAAAAGLHRLGDLGAGNGRSVLLDLGGQGGRQLIATLLDAVTATGLLRVAAAATARGGTEG